MAYRPLARRRWQKLEAWICFIVNIKSHTLGLIEFADFAAGDRWVMLIAAMPDGENKREKLNY